MKINQTSLSGRMLFILSGISLFTILFFPMWQIQLSAPQYPEGLVMLIYPNKIGGNVDIINGLNHYIGMKTIHAGDFIEFTILPYIICFFSVLFILAGIIGKRKFINIAFILFVCFGVVAMADFWKWEYNYGHNLNPDAAIIVPGMSYQPPLIGYKQLLNFGAYSIPDTGGWIFVAVGIILLFVVFREWYAARPIKKSEKLNTLSVLTIFFMSLFCSSCNAGPVPLKPGIDNCQFCKMTISDIRYGAEIITLKGKAYKFDDPQCVLSFLKAHPGIRQSLKEVYFTNFSEPHSLIASASAFVLKSENLRAPMGGMYTVFSSMGDLNKVKQEFPGSVINWTEMNIP
jgi:copper chaperone NosL